MSYNYTVRIEVPASQAVVAAKIGMSMDPDAGGRLSFNPVIIDYTEGEMPEPIYGDNIFVSTPCRQEFAEQVSLLIANPAMLHAVVAQDYAARWPDEVLPTLAECVSFCASVIPDEPSSPN